MLRSAVWQLLTDVSARPIGPIYKDVKMDAVHFGIKVLLFVPLQGESNAAVTSHNLDITSRVLNNYKSAVLWLLRMCVKKQEMFVTVDVVCLSCLRALKTVSVDLRQPTDRLLFMPETF